MASRHGFSRFAVIVGASLVVLALVFASGWWAASVTFGSRSVKEEPGETVTAEAREGTVGRVFNFGLTIQIPTAAVTTNSLTGVVTRVGEGEAKQGGVLYVVGDQPVVAVVSAAPFYRDLAEGVKGADVTALQEMLKQQGTLSSEPDGTFGQSTSAALKDLQKKLGAPASGIAPLGSLVAFSELPTPITFKDGFRPGVAVSSGDEIVSAAVGDREFFVDVSSAQSEFVPVGARVTFSYGGETFTGVISATERASEMDSIRARLSGIDGGSVCDSRCDVLPAAPQTSLLAEVRPEEPVTGIVVPAAAVQSTPSGTTFVTMSDGERRDVTVTGSGQGLVVVDGLRAGEQVQLAQGATPAPGGTPSQDPSQPVEGDTPTDETSAG